MDPLLGQNEEGFGGRRSGGCVSLTSAQGREGVELVRSGRGGTESRNGGVFEWGLVRVGKG